MADNSNIELEIKNVEQLECDRIEQEIKERYNDRISCTTFGDAESWLNDSYISHEKYNSTVDYKVLPVSKYPIKREFVRVKDAVYAVISYNFTDEELTKLSAWCQCPRCQTFWLWRFTKCACCYGCVSSGNFGARAHYITAALKEKEECD